MAQVNQIIVDEEFKKLIPPLSDEEYKGLENDIIANGCMLPLLIWPQDNGSYILIDGHNRYEICRKHSIPFKANKRDFSSRQEAMLQIINLQLNRRNLNPFRRIELAVKYQDILAGNARKAMSEGGKKSQEMRKKAIEEAERIELEEADRIKDLFEEDLNAKAVEPGEDDIPDGFLPPPDEAFPDDFPPDGPLPDDFPPDGPMPDDFAEDIPKETKKKAPKRDFVEESKRRTDTKIGELAGVSRDTVRKYRNIDQNAGEEIKAKARNNEISINQADKIASMPEEVKQQIIEKILAGESVKKVVKEIEKTSYDTSKEDELFSPQEYTDAAVSAMGGIDLDPASCEEADKTIDADQYYSKQDNGLEKDWNGRIWLNPPRTGDKQEMFIEKLLEEIDDGNVTQACVLTDASTEKPWAQGLWKKASAVLFIKGAVDYGAPEGQRYIRTRGQMITYYGENTEAFMKEFGRYGTCMKIMR